MKQHNTVFLSILLGFGLSLTPLRAQSQDPIQKPPEAAQVQAPGAFAGDLVDAQCRMNAPNDKCEITASTKVFGLMTSDGKYYRLDGEGNAKVLTALKSSGEKTGAIKVSINGTETEGTLKVERVEIR